MNARLFRRLLNLNPGEVAPCGWAFLYYFFLLAGYYMLRPLREEMGIAGGVENLQWMFTATFLVMLLAVPLYGRISARFPRRRFVPLVYWFFIVNLLIFYALFQWPEARVWVARAFFVWMSVFNLFVVSVFWSLLVDLFDSDRARRLFGLIAAGGSAGAIFGPTLTALLVTRMAPTDLLPLAVISLLATLLCIHKLLSWSSRGESAEAPPLGGGMWAGFRLLAGSRYLQMLALFMVLFTTLSTFLYFQQAYIVRDAFDSPAQRTQVFAFIDLGVNVLTVFTQLFVTGRLLRGFPLTLALMLVPVMLVLGFTALALAPTLAVLIVVQVVRRAGNYAVTRPAREVLYTLVDRESKYKAKNVLDTVVYRGGDAASGWLFSGMRTLGLPLSATAWLAVPLAGLWMLSAWWLGRRYDRMEGVASHRAREPGQDKEA